MKNHTILVTGANRGIGFEFAKQYAEAGAHVLACCRKPRSASDLQQLAKLHDNLDVLKLDVNSAADINKLTTTLKEQPVDILINNAGIAGESGVTLGNIDVDNMLNVFKTNVIAPVKMVEALLPNLKKGKRKLIVNISSRMGSISDNTSGMSYAYRTSKAGLNMVMKSVSVDLHDQGITVLQLHPGWVKTDMTEEQGTFTPQESVSALRKVIEKTKFRDSGHFYNNQGEALPW